MHRDHDRLRRHHRVLGHLHERSRRSRRRAPGRSGRARGSRGPARSSGPGARPRAAPPAPPGRPTRRAWRLSSDEIVCRLFLTRWCTSRMAASFESSKPVQAPHVGDVTQQDHRPGHHAVGEQRDAVDEHDDVGTALHLLDDRPARGERPLDGRLLDAEVAEAPPLGLGVDPHAVEGVHGVGRCELHPAVGVDHHDAVADPRRLLGADVLVGEGEGRLGHHVGQALEDVEVGPLVHGRRTLERRQRHPQQDGDDPALEADRDVLDRDRLAQDRVVDAAAHDLARVQALCDQGPLGLVDRLAHQVLLDQGGPVVGAHLAEHDQLGVLLGHRGAGIRTVAATSTATTTATATATVTVARVHRHEEEEIGEGEVGQDAPAPEQPLEVLELLGLEVGVALGELGGCRHQPTAPVAVGGAAPTPPPGAGRGPVAPQHLDAHRRQHGAQVVGPVGHVVEVVGVGGRGERHPAGHEALEQAQGGVLLTDRLAPARPRRARPPCPTTRPPRPSGPTTRRGRRARGPPP